MGRIEDGRLSLTGSEEHQRHLDQRLGCSIEYEPKINTSYPGYLDFVSEVVSGLHAAEAGLLLVDAVAGAEVGAELAWDRLTALDKPRLVLVNKMDRENANFQKAVDSLRETLTGSTILPLQLPIGEADSFKGVVSLVSMKAYMGAEGKEAPIPDDMRDEVEAARLAMIEAAAETDDELVMKYLEGEELTEEEIRHGLHQGVKNCTITPVYCGSAIADIGLDRLLHALLRYVPAPGERTITANKGDEAVELTNDPAGPVALQTFRRSSTATSDA